LLEVPRNKDTCTYENMELPHMGSRCGVPVGIQALQSDDNTTRRVVWIDFEVRRCDFKW
jgi:porphobilinogen deaminase